MKLYSVGRSPFAARVRTAAKFKGIALDLAAPPAGGLKGEAYLALNPIGKLPVLRLDDGRTIPESAVILDYLESIHADPPLLPADPLAAASAALIDRVTELYVLGPLFRLFPQAAPKGRDEAVVDALFAEVRAGLVLLDRFLRPAPYAAGPAPTRPDCLIAPAMFWVDEVAGMFQRPDPAAGLETLAIYLAFVAEEPILGLLREEMAQDLAALRAGT
jgi:glutathione S-transferase